jgi:hypothetical protein
MIASRCFDEEIDDPMKPVAFASIGECMIELSAGKDDLWRMGFAGDTFNTAWYARAILPKTKRVGYVTALGDDPSLTITNG